jgi:acetyltransferase
VLRIDGRPVRIRPLTAADLALERAFVQGLSPETIYNRLLGAGVSISDEWLSKLVDVDQRTHVALAATVLLDDGVEAIVGVGRYVVRPDGRTAEFAVAISDSWQGKGIGTALMGEVMACARAAGLVSMTGELFVNNTGMQALLLKLGFATTHVKGEAGVTVATKRLRRVRRVVLPAGILS